MKGGKRKSFSEPKTPKVDKSNPTGGCMKGSGGFAGRVPQTGKTGSVKKKGNP